MTNPVAPTTGPPYALVLGMGCGVLLLAAAFSEIRDIDLYWHLLAGEELASGVPVDLVGATWSFSPDPSSWTTTQWLSETPLYLVHRLASWGGLAAFRLLSAALVLAILAVTTLRASPLRLAAFPFLIAAIPVGMFAQERPQQATWVGAAILGGVLVRGLAGSTPLWWVVLPATALWANVHGGWILVPGVLALLALARFMDHGPRDSAGRRFAVLAAAGFAAGALTPAGLGGLSAPIRFVGATRHIAEWQATQPWSIEGSVTVAMLFLFMVGWSRPVAIPRSEILVVITLLVFSWAAWRNIVPGLLLLAPVAAERLTRSFASSSNPRAEPAWSVPVGLGVATAALLLGLVSMPFREHLPLSDQPIRLAQKLSELQSGQRVLNDYNVAGVALYFGGTDTRVAIDGRADRYSAEYVDAYSDMFDLQGDWRTLLARLAPTSALIKADTALAQYLVADAGWTEVASEGDYLVLTAPVE